MGKDSKIEWTHHTFNPWRGCTKVSAGCAHCYAESMAARNPGVLGVWGDKGTRVVASDAMWREPLKWNREAAAEGVRRRVFCASMADVYGDRDDVVSARARLFALIRETPALDWLLLTKRPENIMRLSVGTLIADVSAPWPDNVWIGTSVEDQRAADERIPHLLRVPARVRFLSMEPLLGRVDLGAWVAPVCHCGACGEDHDGMHDRCPSCGRDSLIATWGHEQADRYRSGERYDETSEDGQRDLNEGCGIGWVIVGGESGPGARPMHPQWARDVRDQCAAAGVPFFFKQWGEHDPDGRRVGKHAAGRVLDSYTHDGLPGAP